MLLLQGDCLELMKTLPDKSVDLFLCDLPYGCLSAKPLVIPNTENKYRKACPPTDRQGCDWDVKIDLTQFWVQVQRLMRDDHTPILHFCTAKFGFELYNSKPDWFRYDLIWNKMRGVAFLQANKMPMRSHELIYVFAKKGARYYRKDIEGDFKKAGGDRDYKPDNGIYGSTKSEAPPDNEGKRCVKSVIDVNGVTRKGNHPTQKPADLYEWLITRYSKEGDTVLDPTAGSFTSVFTAESLGRKGIGMEKNEGFYNKANERSLTL